LQSPLPSFVALEKEKSGAGEAAVITKASYMFLSQLAYCGDFRPCFTIYDCDYQEYAKAHHEVRPYTQPFLSTLLSSKFVFLSTTQVQSSA